MCYASAELDYIDSAQRCMRVSVCVRAPFCRIGQNDDVLCCVKRCDIYVFQTITRMETQAHTVSACVSDWILQREGGYMCLCTCIVSTITCACMRAYGKNLQQRPPAIVRFENARTHAVCMCVRDMTSWLDGGSTWKYQRP